MNGHARDGGDGDGDGLAVYPYRPPVALRRVKPANDNKPPLARRIFRALWGIAVILTLAWIIWVGFR